MYGPDDGAVYQSNNGAQMYGPSEDASTADILGSGYQYDTGQELFGNMRNNFETPERPNSTDVGAQDLVRTGKYKFEVKNNKYGGFVEVEMSKFEVGLADHLEPNTGNEFGTAETPAKEKWPN